MSGRIPEHVVQQIARSADIVRLIGRYTRLKKRGKSYVGLCPFHKEKTPSFTVDPKEGLYYCFGCKEGGNVFTFLKEVEGLEFYEALQHLAREAGIDLRQYGNDDDPSREIRQDLRGVLELVATFYQKCLEKARGSDQAREYLKKRKINEESIERWRLGYSPDGWEHVLNLAHRRNIPPDMLEKAGLVKPRDNAQGHYDRFRNRLMFPVRDRNHAPI
ncbi:MAG: DNA primase, partial [Planctomycetota bacterium]